MAPRESSERLRPTATDYALTALAPALIMGMIGSLTFFLVMVIYQGDFPIRLMYILGLFTFASVLIARIAIEQSRAASFGYALVLGLVTLLVINQLVQFSSGLQSISFLITAGLLALIIVLADRITFDCTLIDENKDGTGEGLLQSLGFLDSTLAAERRQREQAANKKATKRKRRQHNPGIWVLYFAFMALPLFGLGQWAIPASEVATRRAAFWFLIAYLGCAFILLVTTSFLGMRRYLRQRKVTMPPDMIWIWLLRGSGGVLLILVVAFLLPIPAHPLGWLGADNSWFSSKNVQASRAGWGRETTQDSRSNVNRVTDPNRRSEQSSTSGDEGQGSAREGRESYRYPDTRPNNSRSPAEDPNASRAVPAEQNPTQPADPSGSGQANSRDQQNASNPSSPSQPNPSSTSQSSLERFTSIRLPTHMDEWFKWIVQFILAAIVLGYLIFYWREVLAALNRIWSWLTGYWLKPTSVKPDDSAAPTIEQVAPRAFSTFVDPFNTHNAGWDAERILRHFFAAVEAWGYEQKMPRLDNETPEEYLHRMMDQFPEQENQWQRLGVLYNQLAYAQSRPDRNQVERLATFWRWLHSRSTLRVY